MTPQNSLLVVDDNEAFRKTLALEFQERGYEVVSTATVEQTRTILKTGFEPTFAILDLRIKEELGFRLIQDILKLNSHCRVVMLTGYPTIATTVEAMRLGAVNYLVKPIPVEMIEQALWLNQINDRFDFSESDVQSQSLAQHETEFIEFVLSQCDWNITQAARRLGIHRQSLQRKIRKLPESSLKNSLEI